MALFTWVLRTSILASILVVFILLIKVLLRDRLGPKWHYYIWFLVLLRLIIPIDLQSPVSIYNYFATPRIASVSTDPSNSREPMAQPKDGIREGRIPGGSEPIEAEPLPPETSTPPVFPSIFDIAFYIWLAGVIVLVLHMVVLNIKYRNAIKGKESLHDGRVLQLFEESKEKLGISERIPLVQTDMVNTTTLYGFFQPRLLLPSNINGKLSLEELRYIFYHELSHIKQKDIAINFVSGVLQIFHWFNPIIWYGFFRMRQDREVACDALALSFLHPQEYRKYGKVIIDLIETYSSPVQLPGMIGIVNDGSNIKKRIAMISVFRKNTYKLSVTAIVLLLIFGVVFLTSAGGDAGIEGRGNTVMDDLEDKEEAPATKPEEPRGNTTGNIANGGLIAYNDGWIYYSNLEDGGKLYKKREDGSGVTLLSNNLAVEINVVGDWVYYNNGKHLFHPWGNIYKVRTDGTQEIRLNGHDSRFVQVVGDWIYYIGFDVENQKVSLYKMKTDGSAQTMIIDKAVVSFFILENWIYYTDADGHGLSRIKKDGSDHKFLTNRDGYFFNPVGDWVYFQGEGDHVYRRSIDGSSVTRLSEDAAFNINVKGDWIYYVNHSEGWLNIYRMRTDGSQRERINDERSLHIFVAGDWIYYTSANDFLSGYRKIRINSSEQTGPRAGESVDGEDVRKKLEEIAIEVLGKAPISTSDLATDDDMTTPGVESVRYNKYIPYSRIIIRFVPNSGVGEKILAQVETEVVKLLDKIATIPEIDILIGELIIEVCLPTEARVYGELAEIWMTKIELLIKGETLAQTNWGEVNNGQLWEIVEVMQQQV